MALLRARTPLSPAERAAKRRLLLHDTLALVSLFAITAVLAVLTFVLFRSYSQHQSDAAARWLRRGRAALAAGKPLIAVNALRSALAYNPGDRTTEVLLAESLAQSGKVQEATAYFNTLWEAEPGNGLINLQLARLAIASNRPRPALEYYHAAIYGTWEGDGAVRRRTVRLEMVDHLLALGMFDDARNELLIAAGNTVETDIQGKLQIASLLMGAHATPDALHLYREIAETRPPRLEALAGAGRAAFLLGRYRLAQQYLNRALTAAGSSSAGKAAPSLQEERNELQQATRLLELYPSPALPPEARAERVLANRALAQKRFASCSEAASPAAAPPGPGTAPAASPGPLAAIAARWAAEPRRLRVSDLLRDPARLAGEISLTDDTEAVTATVCGPATGDDALLLKLAQAGDAVEQR